MQHSRFFLRRIMISILFCGHCSLFQKYDREETQEELDNALQVSEIGENLSEQEEEYNFDSDDSREYEEDAEEDDHNAAELDAKKVLKALQPIIEKRIKFFESVREQKREKTIETKGKRVYVSKFNKTSTQCKNEKTKSINVAPAAADAVSSTTSNVVAETPVKKLAVNRGNYEEIEETVTTTTVITTTKKVRRVVTLDRADENTNHVKRKLSMISVNEDEEYTPKKRAPKSETRRKTMNGASTKKLRNSIAMNAIQAASNDKSIVLYEPIDACKYDTAGDETLKLEPNELNEVIFNKTHLNKSGNESMQVVQLFAETINVDREATLIFQMDGDGDDHKRVAKAKSKVDVLHRFSRLSMPKLCIEKRSEN